MKDYYKILELDITATAEKIKTQHKLLLHAWHPDKFPNGELKIKAHEKILEINEAYSILGNEIKRHSYDQKYRNEFQNTYSSNSVDRNSGEKVRNQSKNTTSQKQKPDKRISVIIFIIFVLFFLYSLYSVISNVMQGQGDNQQVTNNLTNTLIPTRILEPSPTLDPLIDLRKRCLYWSDIDSSLVGEEVCIFGEIVTFTPKEEIRVPAIGSEWIWYYYFSHENKNIFIIHPSNEVAKLTPDQKFPDSYTGCIEVFGELRLDRTNGLYIEIWSGNSQNWEILNDC